MTTELSLYGIVDEIKSIEDLLEVNEGELEVSEEIRLKVLSEMIQNKTDACIGFIHSQEDLVTMAKARMKILSDFITARENKIESFEKYIMDCMGRLDVKELNGQMYKLKLRKPSEILVIENESQIPTEFIKTVTTVSTDKTALKKHIKEGATVPGVYIGEGKQSLMKSLKTGK